MTRFAILLGAVVLAACGGDDPVSYSAPVGINLKVESGDVSGAAISNDKDITNETGNPYGDFVTDARDQIGTDPTRVELEHLTLTLGAQSTGVTALEQVYVGDVDVLFLMHETNNTYPAGRVTNPSGAGPIEVDVLFESDAVATQDWSKFLSGGYKVSIRGPAAPDFSTKGATADLLLSFTFAAFE